MNIAKTDQKVNVVLVDGAACQISLATSEDAA
jgi:hypothetical protein